MGNLISFDHTFFIQLVNFLITLVVLNFLLIKPVRDQISARKTLTDGYAADVARFTQEADMKLRGYEETLSAARVEASKAREAAKEEGRGREQQLLAAAQSDAQKFVLAARADTAKDMKAAGDALAARVDAFAAQAISKILG